MGYTKRHALPTVEIGSAAERPASMHHVAAGVRAASRIPMGAALALMDFRNKYASQKAATGLVMERPAGIARVVVRLTGPAALETIVINSLHMLAGKKAASGLVRTPTATLSSAVHPRPVPVASMATVK
jgi:hypothetical protein